VILRLVPAALLGIWISAVLFWLMHAMLERHDARLGSDPVKQIDFVRLQRQETAPEIRSREPPPLPPPSDAAPPPVQAVAANPNRPVAPAFDAPKLSLSIGGGTIAAPVSGAFGSPIDLSMAETGPSLPAAFADAPLAPVVRIPPTYPLDARRRKIEGWVKLEFTVQEDGTVAGVQVKAAEPAGVFEQAATASIARWKFRPAVENGKAVRKRAAQTLKFELDR
jgi:protein TonB